MTTQQIKEEFAHLSSLKDDELHSTIDIDYYEIFHKRREVAPTKRQVIVSVLMGAVATMLFITNLIILFGR